MAQAKPVIVDIWGSTGATTDPGPTQLNLGWTAEIPTHQVQNFWQKRADEMLVHYQEQGIAVHDTVTDYPVDAYTRGSDGNVYVSLQTPNINQDPTVATTFWELLGVNLGGAQNVAASGYMTLPGGLIHQWTVVTLQAANSTQLVNLPIAFPNAGFGIQATISTGGVAVQNQGGTIRGTFNSLSDLEMLNTTNTTQTYYLSVIGN